MRTMKRAKELLDELEMYHLFKGLGVKDIAKAKKKQIKKKFNIK